MPPIQIGDVMWLGHGLNLCQVLGGNAPGSQQPLLVFSIPQNDPHEKILRAAKRRGHLGVLRFL